MNSCASQVGLRYGGHFRGTVTTARVRLGLVDRFLVKIGLGYGRSRVQSLVFLSLASFSPLSLTVVAEIPLWVMLL